MKADYIYFGDSGLTSTSANHVANMAKESVKNVADELSGVSFYGSTVSLLSGGDPKQYKVGNTADELEKTYENLAHIGEAHALIAWLREAIKARERLLGEVKQMTLENYCGTVLGGVDVPEVDTSIEAWARKNGRTMPDINGNFPELKDEIVLKYYSLTTPLDRFCYKFNLQKPASPRQQQPMTEDEYMATLSVKDRNRMLLLEAKAAAIGKFIHDDGKFSEERKHLRMVVANPVAAQGDGQNMMLLESKPSVSQEYVDGMFFRLAAEHRALQAELNGMLAERERTIEADKQRKAAEHQKACDAYKREMGVLQDKLQEYLTGERQKMSQMQAEYNAWASEQKARQQQLSADLEAWKLSEAKRIAALGIIIPNDLRPVYERVNGLGK